MAYEKTVWKNNEAPKINATNLNKIENGIANAVETDSVARVTNVVSKNLLNLYNFQSQTINGVTFTKNKDNSITINGTATSGFGVNFVKLKIKAGTYHLSLNEAVTNDFYIYDYDTNTGIISNNSTATLTQDYNNVGFDTWINSGTTFNNVTIYPQLEEGSTATPYTPYLNLEELQEKSNDTGWLEAPLETDTSTLDWHKLSYRKINGIVYVSGIFKLLNPSWGKVFATLPQGFRPKVEADFACRGVNNATVVVAITNNGKMAVLQLVPGDFSSEVSGLVSCSFIADN